MKIVLYSQRVEVIESYQERRDCADQRIADFIYACGFLPLPVPNRKDFIREVIIETHPVGIILTGGNSLVQYGGNAPERDALDRELIEIAIEKNLPLYGFCRGMQSILDYFGNTLVQVEGHVAVRHMVHGTEGDYEVNSYHNQGCKELNKGCGLIIDLQAEDGVIEQIHHESLPIAATMWHPERESTFTEKDMDRVKRLFSK